MVLPFTLQLLANFHFLVLFPFCLSTIKHANGCSQYFLTVSTGNTVGRRHNLRQTANFIQHYMTHKEAIYLETNVCL